MEPQRAEEMEVAVDLEIELGDVWSATYGTYFAIRVNELVLSGVNLKPEDFDAASEAAAAVAKLATLRAQAAGVGTDDV